MKRGDRFQVIALLLLILAILHSITHFSIYGTSIPGFFETGLSGFSIGKNELGEELKTTYPRTPLYSQMIIILEWLSIIIIFIFGYVRHVFAIKQEEKFPHGSIETIHAQQGNHHGIKTDIDALYELLREKKRLRFSVIARLFHVTSENVMEWAKILEEGDMATIIYPRWGEPELALADNTDNIQEKKKYNEH